MEKLANHIALQSITEGGMEKRAFNVAQLLHMGRNFALRGKLDRFKALVDRRAQAAHSSFINRSRAYSNAANKHDQAQKYILDSDVNPFLGKRHSTFKRLPVDPIRIPRNPNSIDRDAATANASNALGVLLDHHTDVRDIALDHPPFYNSDQLETFSRALRRLDPMLHRKVLTTGSF